MRFKELQLSDKALIEKFLINNPKELCDYCFADLYLWKDYYHTEIAIEADVLYLRHCIDNEPLYFMPLGHIEKGIQCLIDYTREKKEKLRIINIEEVDLPFFEKFFYRAHTRSNDDYLYSAKELSLLAGKKYKSKRNFVNSFQKKYSYEVKPIDEFNEKEDLELLDFWAKASEEDIHSFSGEKEAIIQALRHFKSLKLTGLVLVVDHRVAGITVGSFGRDTFITHFEKVKYQYAGASQMINYLLANYVKNKASYINREEDLGIPGLRQAKLSYRPIRLIKSFTAYYREDYLRLFNNTNEIIEIG